MGGDTATNSFNSLPGCEPGPTWGTRGRSLAGSAFPGRAWERDEKVRSSPASMFPFPAPQRGTHFPCRCQLVISPGSSRLSISSSRLSRSSTGLAAYPSDSFQATSQPSQRQPRQPRSRALGEIERQSICTRSENWSGCDNMGPTRRRSKRQGVIRLATNATQRGPGCELLKKIPSLS